MDLELVALQDWNTLITHPSFNLLKDRLKGKITHYDNEIRKLIDSPSLDNTFKLGIISAKRSECEELLFLFETKIKEYQLRRKNV